MSAKHTELPWMAASAYSSVVGVPIVNREGRRIANTAIPDMPKEWDHLKKQAVTDAAFICTAVNTYPVVTELVDALEAWLAYAENKLSEFDIEDCAADDETSLCARCRSNGCINQKIRKARSALAKFKDLAGNESAK